MILEFAVAGWGCSCWRFWVVTFGDVTVDNTPSRRPALFLIWYLLVGRQSLFPVAWRVSDMTVSQVSDLRVV
jgi:hypothetical protein